MSFRCDVTGEKSKEAVWGTKEWTHELTGETRTVYTMLEPAEKPLKIVVTSREVSYDCSYEDEDGYVEHFTTNGKEVVKEITIRACNYELAKKVYNL